jgi:hypothetical protein
MMKYCSRRHRHTEQGYVLLVLLLSLALLSIGFTVMIQGIEFEIKRDREEELIHRGVQYSRAVRKFIKAFGRYPNSVEELENTNNIRFLRKRYKDPVTGKDFKVLHLMDLPSSKPIVGATTVASLVSQQRRSSGALNPSTEDPGVPVVNGSSDSQSPQSDDQTAPGPPNPTRSDGSDATTRGQQSRQPTPAPPTQPRGGGPMVGVASVSKAATIREFSKKNHYNDWQFVYDPSTDRGVLLTTPNQPVLRAAQLADQQNDQSVFRALRANAHTNPADGVQSESPTSQ